LIPNHSGTPTASGLTLSFARRAVATARPSSRASSRVRSIRGGRGPSACTPPLLPAAGPQGARPVTQLSGTEPGTALASPAGAPAARNPRLQGTIPDHGRRNIEPVFVTYEYVTNSGPHFGRGGVGRPWSAFSLRFRHSARKGYRMSEASRRQSRAEEESAKKNRRRALPSTPATTKNHRLDAGMHYSMKAFRQT